jgi:hypothetical protein
MEDPIKSRNVTRAYLYVRPPSPCVLQQPMFRITRRPTTTTMGDGRRHTSNNTTRKILPVVLLSPLPSIS